MEQNTLNQPLVGTTEAPKIASVGVGAIGATEMQPHPVASTLRKLEVGGQAVFPIEQRSTVLNTLSRFRSDYSRQGWDAELHTNKQNFTVIVTRVS